MKTTFKPFWMVTRKPMKGQGTLTHPKHRHYDEGKAVEEAQRLANLTGQSFVVLEAKTRVNPEHKE